MYVPLATSLPLIVHCHYKMLLFIDYVEELVVEVPRQLLSLSTLKSDHISDVFTTAMILLAAL